MNKNVNGPQQGLTARDREDHTAGGSEPIVAQLSRRREAASRSEPLACGHRDPLDCTATCGQPPTPTASPELREMADQVEPGDIVGLWADAKSLFFARDFPPYGSKEWIDLHPDDPRRLAAALDAAECWRKYGDGVTQWLRDATAPKPPLWQGRTHAELVEARKPKPPWVLKATPGWPPIAIPGQPGRYLTCEQRHQGAA